MRFFKAVFVLITLTFFVSLAQAESKTETVEIKNWDESNNNVLIYRDSDQEDWLLHYKDTCNFLEGQSHVKLATEDFLDGYGASSGDFLMPVNLYNQKCEINQAETVDAVLHLQYASASGSLIILKDKSDSELPLYQISVTGGCDLIGKHSGGNIYLQRSGYKNLNEWDILILPDKDGQCSIESIEEIDNGQDSEDSQTSGAAPQRVRNVWVLPGSKKVSLFWDDIEGVDQYLVGYTGYHVDVAEPLEELPSMPNLLKTDENSIEITNLKNGELYFFYVAAEKSGKTGKFWSEEITATPYSYLETHYNKFKNPVFPDSNKNSPSFEINTQETLTHFIFKWKKPSMSQSFVIRDEKGILMSTDRFRNDKFHFLKTPQRRGKSFELTINGQTVPFSF